MFLLRALWLAYRLWLACVAGYLVGSILAADVIARLATQHRRRAVDLRRVGSGNPGAANAIANLGKGWGGAVLAGDILKGAAGAQAGRMLAGPNGAYLGAAAAVAGHCFPAWSGFRGGKGVATSAGTTLAAFPAYVPFDAAMIGVSWFASRHAGKATAFATVLFVVSAFLWNHFHLPNAWGPRPTRALPLYAAVTAAIISYKFLTAPAHLGDLKGTDGSREIAEPSLSA